MKISAVSNSHINNTNRRSNNPAFKGISDGLVAFWQFVDNGGRAIQFTVEDMCGTNLPRTYKGAMAGYKYTGKINYAALAQEALREFLTGPTMCATPFGIILLTRKLLGKTADTHIENIKNLSHIMSGLEKQSSQKTLDKDFIQAVVLDMIKKTAGKEDIDQNDAKVLTDKILAYKELVDMSEMPKKKIKELNIEKPTRAELKKELADVEKVFESIVKKNKDSYSDTSFLTAKYTVSNCKTGATKAKNYIDYAINYVNDFKKVLKTDSSMFTNETVQNFKSSWLAKRLCIIASMIGVTGFAMSFIPKIYTKFSGNVNPNAKDIYNEAEKLPNQRKGVKA